MRYAYEVSQQELVARESSSGATVWRGRPEGHRVWRTLSIPGEEDCLVLSEYWTKSDRPFRNLMQCRPDGSVVWRAELPDRGVDVYVAMDWNDNRLLATSWSGWEVVVDVKTGAIVSTTFTKGM